MKPWWTLLLLMLGPWLSAQRTTPAEGPGRFRAVDIYIDSGATPLAAYQIEFSVTNGVAKIVGIEGGGHPAFREPPLYDPKAMQRERVIVAAFSTEPADKLPTGKTRVAAIHLQLPANQEPHYVLKLQTAGNPQGTKFAAEVSLKERKPQ